MGRALSGCLVLQLLLAGALLAVPLAASTCVARHLWRRNVGDAADRRVPAPPDDAHPRAVREWEDQEHEAHAREDRPAGRTPLPPPAREQA